MHSQISNSDSPSSAFDLLAYDIQRFIWERKWSSLRDIQEAAIPAILQQQDVIIAAATASGKTEAAFFPILTKLLQNQANNPTVLYISPLKALINDQWDRLELLCDHLQIKVTPWHGDVSAAHKQQFLKNPAGCVLITPESLEALLMHYGCNVGDIFAALEYCVIDEVHAFLGNERGKQLQSLLHRIDLAVGRKIPRVGLSATLGDLSIAAQYIRPENPANVTIIRSQGSQQNLKILLYGYQNEQPTNNEENTLHFAAFATKKLFAALRGSNNLIFPNSRRNVELFSDQLRQMCHDLGVPNEFWPHHGNLAKNIREETERSLKRNEQPTTAICTNTLELGIDIGTVKSIAQIGSPPSVASLRQRLGRSGRKAGEAAILRAFNNEISISSHAKISDQLHEELLQSIAMIQLLLEGWCEPSAAKGLYLSTFIQQLLSLVVQFGGISIHNAWQILCSSGIFPQLSKADFLVLLQHLAAKKIIMQDATGLLLLAELGEKLVNHYTFYASFSTDSEFKLVSAGKTLGTLPISRSITLNSYIIFAGKRWRVNELDEDKKIITVIPDFGGKAPLFSGTSMRLQGKIRTKMREILQSTDQINFLDPVAARLLEEARFYYQQLHLSQKNLIADGKNILLFLWQSDEVQDTLELLLQSQEYRAINNGLFVSVEADSSASIRELLQACCNDTRSAGQLAKFVENKHQEKWDWLLPEALLCENYAAKYLALDETRAAIAGFLAEMNE